MYTAGSQNLLRILSSGSKQQNMRKANGWRHVRIDNNRSARIFYASSCECTALCVARYVSQKRTVANVVGERNKKKRDEMMEIESRISLFRLCISSSSAVLPNRDPLFLSFYVLDCWCASSNIYNKPGLTAACHCGNLPSCHRRSSMI